MGAIDIKTAVTQMDGIFGCKVSFELNPETKKPEYTFAKKTIVDFFCGLFAGADEKSEQSANVILALMEISAQVKDADNENSKLDALVKKYTTNHDLIDFREIRRTLREFSEIEFPPVVFTRPAAQAIETAETESDNLDARQATGEGAGLNASAPAFRAPPNAVADRRALENNKNGPVGRNADSDVMQEIDDFLNYKGVNFDKLISGRGNDLESTPESAGQLKAGVLADTGTNTTTSAPKKFFPKGFSNSASEKEEFEKIYRYRIGESIRNNAYKIELVRDADGDVSDDNLEALAETMVAIEWLTKKPISVSCGEKDAAEFKAISDRLDTAFICSIAEHGNPYAPEPVKDLDALKKEVEELCDRSRTAFLQTSVPDLRRSF
jgi:hypothetical protein